MYSVAKTIQQFKFRFVKCSTHFFPKRFTTRISGHHAQEDVHQDIFSPDSARTQPRFGIPQMKLKLAHNVGRDMPNPQ